jgi:UDP-N-acetylmuramoyl-tripeptide--D-alanyl-D-alanine ligase
MTLLWTFSTLIALLWLAPLTLLARRGLHILQLEEYENRRLLRWAGSPQAQATAPWRRLGLGFAIVISVASLSSLKLLAVLLLALWLVPAALLLNALRPQPAKKPLVYTARVRRLIAAVVVVALALIAVVAVVSLLLLRERSAFAAAILTPTLPIAVLLTADALLVAGGNVLAAPVEAMIRRRYLNEAHARIRRLNPTVIGITGSYGKTTTKELLASVLSSRFRTVKTPESWNTPMGLTRAIRERLTEQHEIFVVEMGAYQRGDIGTLCRLTGPPRIGILTGVNEQHQERMGSIENTMKTKYELIEAVQPGGLAIFNADNPYVRRLAEQTAHVRVVRVGIDPANGPFDYTAREISVSPEGTRFTVVAGGAAVPFRTRLLGEHFILNVLAATAAAVECGMTLPQIAAAVASVPPVPHRLQLLPSPEGITTIDDAYSANPDGARAALRVLSGMRDGKRILVTPGFVELGAQEEAFNRDLGRLATAACDILVLVGPRRTAPIREGALGAGMSADRIEVVRSIADARAYLAHIARPGDTILFENDLPDNYGE